MKNLLKNTLFFIALSIAFSSLTACTKTSTANSKNGAVIEVGSNASNSATKTETANTDSVENFDNPYPTAPEAILQTENKDLDGKVLKFADYKGKVVLINLWATWCGPCRAEMPSFIELQEKYKDKDFEIVGLDVDEESVEEINTFSKEMKLNYKLGYADSKMVSAFIRLTKLQGIPQTIVIDRDSRLVAAVGGGGQQKVNEIKMAVDKAMGKN